MQSVCQKCWWNFEKAQHAAGGAVGQVQVQVVQLGIIIIENTDTDTNSTCFKWSQKISNAIYRQNIGSKASVLQT